jgi:hypothetical protein
MEQRWGTWFMNVAGLTRFHGGALGSEQHNYPRSWVFTFTDGSDQVTVRCYLHSDDFAEQGWYPIADRETQLSKPFHKPSGR